jgi:CMP-N-acetylneuraminic acid synthetase
MSVLGLILARGGSKRLPGKNTRLLMGQPLITWAIGQGMLSQRIDDLAVSSEDESILEIARYYSSADGFHIIERPKELAEDDVTSYPPMLHALDEMGAFDWLCLLQPTSPLRTPEDIDECIERVQDSDYPAIASYMEGSLVPNGAVYVGRTDWLRDGGNFDGPAVARYDMPANRSVDIDTEEDWQECEFYMESLLFPEEIGYL